jgi:CDP-6-deoxy-D-xylo-4-hexulose-3-dehydrase
MSVPTVHQLCSSSGATNTMTKLTWPLMHNNIVRSDLDKMIEYLHQDDPKLTHGPLVKNFEEEWSNWLGVKHSLMLNSGSSANDLTMMAIRELKGPGEVIVPPLTWVSDISAVIRSGLEPVFVDIDPKSLAISTEKVLAAVTPKTRAVFLTHILGFNGLTDRLLDGLRSKGIPLVEDVCESHGATHNGKKVGSFGLASNFSFYYAHHMTTIEGGMISTDDDELYDVLRMMRSHGMVRESINQETKDKFTRQYPDLNPDFIFAYASHNMRSTELNGLLGLEQLKRLDRNNLVRTRNFDKFLTVINSEIFQTEFKVEGSSNYAFTLVLKKADIKLRDNVEKCLREAGIEFRRGLSGGGNQLRQPYLSQKKDLPEPESMTVTDHIHHYAWYIGNYPELEEHQIEWLGSVLSKLR